MASSNDWHEVKKFVEPIVAEVDAPDVELLDLRVEIFGNDQVSVEATFLREELTAMQREGLLQYAARLVVDAASRQR